MKRRSVIFLATLMVSGSAAIGSAGLADGPKVIRIYWSKQVRIDPGRQPELRRLLFRALEGNRAGPLLVQDSRPHFHSDGIAEMEHSKAAKGKG